MAPLAFVQSAFNVDVVAIIQGYWEYSTTKYPFLKAFL